LLKFILYNLSSFFSCGHNNRLDVCFSVLIPYYLLTRRRYINTLLQYNLCSSIWVIDYLSCRTFESNWSPHLLHLQLTEINKAIVNTGWCAYIFSQYNVWFTKHICIRYNKVVRVMHNLRVNFFFPFIAIFCNPYKSNVRHIHQLLFNCLTVVTPVVLLYTK